MSELAARFILALCFLALFGLLGVAISSNLTVSAAAIGLLLGALSMAVRRP